MRAFKNLLKTEVAFTYTPFYLRYGVPLLLLSWLTFIKVLFEPIGRESPFLMYFGLILITARYFGELAAIVITIFACIVAEYFFIPPYNSFSMSAEHCIQCAVFVSESFLIIGLTRALKKTTLKMNKSDVLFKTIVEKSTEGIVMYSAEPKRLYSSPSVREIFGYSQEEYLEIEPWKLVHDDDLPLVKEQFYRLAAHPGQTITILHRFKHKDGSWRWIESRITNMLEEPLIKAIVSNLRDVTDRVLLEKQREDFIGIASHELKTPLTSLKAFTQVLKNRFKEDSEQSTYTIVSKIDTQESRIIQMVTDLLDLTIVQAGKLVIHKSSFNFNEMVTDVAETMQHLVASHKIVIDLEPLPDIVADSERIAQVLSNLISNAVKYSPGAGSILISSVLEHSNIVLRVTDYGIGISQAEIGQIFDKFYRGEKSADGYQGLGLGLFICAEIIGLHGGNLGAESEPGKGSTFWFSLPLKKPADKQKALLE